MKVIIAIDQSIYWRQVVDAVLRRPWPDDTDFDIVTVLEESPWEKLGMFQSHQPLADLLKKREEFARKVLAEARSLIDTGVKNSSVHVELRHGSARNEIIKAATDWMADKIVLGAHGQAPNRLFSGSVPRAVAQHAYCTVELIRLVDVGDLEAKGKEKLERAFLKTYVY